MCYTIGSLLDHRSSVVLAIYNDDAFILFFPLVFCLFLFFVCLLELDHVITRRHSCLLCGYCTLITFDVTGLGDNCHVLLQGRETVFMCY